MTVGVAEAMSALHSDRVNQTIVKTLPKMPLRERQIFLQAANKAQDALFLPLVRALIEDGDLDDPTFEYFDRRSRGEMHSIVYDALQEPTRERVKTLLDAMNARQVQLCVSQLRSQIYKIEDYFGGCSPDDWDDPNFGDSELEELDNLKTRYGWIIDHLVYVGQQGRSRLSLNQIEQLTGTKFRWN